MTECGNCQTELTPENTREYEGFDYEGYHTAMIFGKVDKAIFTNCDSCFDARIDQYLESMAS